MIRVISLGAGVQSTTLALMAAHGKIGPMPDCAIFADTQWEPAHVYTHLDWLEKQLPFPVYRVTAGNIRESMVRGENLQGKRFASVPWFIRNPDGSKGMGRRQCTKEYKLRPIQRKMVELMGGKRPKGGCETWIGISMDEVIRMKPSQVQYAVNRWPLIELKMSRADCLAWLWLYGYPEPGKSACIGCPFHGDAQWRELPPEEFADAVEVDRAIRHQSGMRGEQFMHAKRIPLDQVDFTIAKERAQNQFLNECEGMCGV